MTAQEEYKPTQAADKLVAARQREEQAIDLMTKTIAGNSRLLDENEDLKTQLEMFKRDELTDNLVRRAYLQESNNLRTQVHDSSHPKGYDSVAILMTDLIKLKKTNKKEGHQGGDMSISAYGRSLEGLAAAIGNIEVLVGRLGGDESAITIAYSSARYTSEALRELAVAEMELNALSTTLFGVRVGDIAVSTPDKEMKELLREADPKLPKTRVQKFGKFITNKYYSTKRKK